MKGQSTLFLPYFFLAALTILCLVTSCRSNTTANNSVSPVKPDTSRINQLLARADRFNQNNFDSMRYYSKLAFNEASAINDVAGMTKAQTKEAQYLKRSGDYPGAIALCLKLADRYDSLRLWHEEISIMSLLADAYKEMGGEKKTVGYLQKALQISREAKKLAEREQLPGDVVECLNEEGIILRDMSKTISRPDLMDSAFDLYSRGIALINSTGLGKQHLQKLYNNISQVYNEHYRNYPKALESLRLSIDLNNKQGNTIGLTYCYNSMADTYMNMGNLDSALYYARNMLSSSLRLKFPFRIVTAYSLLTQVNSRLARYDSALYYSEQSARLSDSINNVMKGSQIMEMQTRYETDKKTEEISSLNKLNREKNRSLLFMAGAALILLVLLLTVWFLMKRSQRQKKQIAQQSEKLQWMMKELHHRVKNNLQIVSSLLNLQSYKIPDEESASVFRESQLRVQAMSLMHQRLYRVEDASLVNFRLYVEDLAETLLKAYGFDRQSFNMNITVDREMLDVDTVMPLGLLLNEILTNSFKYAYASVKHPLLMISLKTLENKLQLEVADNGPGIPAGEKKGFGQQLIKALTKQLNATCSVHLEQGTRYTLLIPYHKAKTV